MHTELLIPHGLQLAKNLLLVDVRADIFSSSCLQGLDLSCTFFRSCILQNHAANRSYPRYGLARISHYLRVTLLHLVNVSTHPPVTPLTSFSPRFGLVVFINRLFASLYPSTSPIRTNPIRLDPSLIIC